MRINSQTELSNLESWDQVARFATIALRDIKTALNGNITFADNLSAKFIDVTFSTANLVSTIPHSLGRVPLMWISGNISAESVIYQGKASDSVNLYLAASAACNVRIMVI
jgi:hypothetical protein